MLVVLFGLAGSGKNFVGECMRDHFGFHFWDADEVLTDDMVECIHQKKIFTQAMRDEFTRLAIAKIKILSSQHQQLAVSMALYKEKNRLMVHQALTSALFIQVKTDQSVLLERLQKRNNSVTTQYAEQIQAQFEEPLLAHRVLINQADKQAIIESLQEIIR